jgi:hypothetical protein
MFIDIHNQQRFDEQFPQLRVESVNGGPSVSGVWSETGHNASRRVGAVNRTARIPRADRFHLLNRGRARTRLFCSYADYAPFEEMPEETPAVRQTRACA